jgi:hypothetical protein
MNKREKEFNTKHFSKSDLFKMTVAKNVSKVAKSHFNRKPYSKGGFIIL